MHVQIYSDIHTEIYNGYPKIPPIADYLILAGDIGKVNYKNFTQFLDYVSQNWLKVFYVLGNHEYYSKKKTHCKLNKLYHELIDTYENIILLDKDVYELDGWQIMGCTLWSHIGDDVKDYTNCLSSISMYKESDTSEEDNATSVRKVPISLEKLNAIHDEERKWLLDAYDPNKNTIIITHYPVIQENIAHPKYGNQSKNIVNLFSNHLVFSPKKELVCISGHTHYSHDFTKNSVRYISNQMGYQEEVLKGNTRFDEEGEYHL